jgi:hypothetical protein
MNVSLGPSDVIAAATRRATNRPSGSLGAAGFDFVPVLSPGLTSALVRGERVFAALAMIWPPVARHAS